MMTLLPSKTGRWLRRIALLGLVSISTASAVSAQTPQPAERNLDAAVARATTAWLSDAIRAEQRQVTIRQSDSLINGALIGAGAGFASGLFLCRAMEPWDVCFNDGNVPRLIGLAALGAGIGIGIDAAIRKKITIYETPGGKQLSAAPMVGRHGAGLRLSLKF